MGFDLFAINFKNIKNIENAVKLNNDSLSVFSYDKEDIQKIVLSLEENNFNSKNKVNIATVNLENEIESHKNK